jgi:hypothetical protein
MPARQRDEAIRRTRETRRGILAAGCFVGLFALAYAFGSGWRTPSPQQAAFTHPRESDDDLTTGSIVFVPVLGNNCRQNLIDNRTWRVRENGAVPCDQALAAAAHRRSDGAPTTRLDIIRESFRNAPR